MNNSCVKTQTPRILSPARRISLDDNKLTGHRKKISALEAVYLVLQMPLRRSSRDFQFISTSPPEERTFLLTRLDKLKELPDNSTDVESDNIIYKRYQSRAKQLEKLCLADFVATFNCVKDEQADTGNATYEPSLTGINDFLPETNFEDNTDDDPNSIHVTKSVCEPNEYILKGGMKLVKRKKPKIICTEHINKQDSALQRKPSELFGCFDSRNNKQHKQYDLLYCIGIFPRNDDEELRLKRMSNDDYYALDRSLNEQQRQFFYHVLHSIKTKDNPIRLFLSGGAGVGKSTVTNALYEALITYLNSIKGENPDKVKVVKTAPTGKAAFDINGNTLHFAFKIPANRGFKYCALDSDRFNTIRSQLKELMLIFIDEISLVGSGMFNFLNLRLQQIMGTKEPFGGIILITVRDLFQLKPVFDKWIFENSQTGYNALAIGPPRYKAMSSADIFTEQCLTQHEGSPFFFPFHKDNIWTGRFMLFELTEIMRQKDDKAFAELLNRLREGKQSDNGEAVLKQRLVSVRPENGNYPMNMTHLFSTNASVDAHNNALYTLSITDKAQIKAVDIIIGDISDDFKTQMKSKIPDDPTMDNGLIRSSAIGNSGKI
ncbi:uncharacterized protein [Montipora foliosa]|uniref:uncharacterized protein n=1 Tax=Montipora foliosa TaxID=591990 RepID=UPI0035F1F3ED